MGIALLFRLRIMITTHSTESVICQVYFICFMHYTYASSLSYVPRPSSPRALGISRSRRPFST